MPKCDKCNQFFPPGFVDSVNPRTGEVQKGNICLFCMDNVTVLKGKNGKQVTKKELIKEYQIFLKKVKENNEILKEGAKGNPIKGTEGIL